MKKPSLSSLLLQQTMKLPAPNTRDLTVDEDLEIPMRDGAVLLADRWSPRMGGVGAPTVLIRGPYARRGLTAAQLARPLAERGFQVILQSARGTFGSEGLFEPLRNERLDGIDTVEWVCKQPWFGESMVLYGSSYQGYTQWAMADQLPPQVVAMIPAMTQSDCGALFLDKGIFGLEPALGWGVLIEQQEEKLAMGKFILGGRRRGRAHEALPLSGADQIALGRHSSMIQEFFTTDRDSPQWMATDHSARVADVTIPASLVTGWYDVFLTGMLRDHRNLVAAGQSPRLTIGPWSHTSPRAISAMVHETLEFGAALAAGRKPPVRAPIRAYVMGADEWRELSEWPPVGYPSRALHLQPGGGLAETTAPASAPDIFRYDPADPTPAVGGSRMLPGTRAGSVDNTRLEGREDVVTYTTGPLSKDIEVMGDVTADIWFRSSLDHADVFVRLCDVDSQGQSTNVCDGIVRLSDAQKLSRAKVSLTATAYRFHRGHRIRVQVSSGAFPQYNRNLGTGQPRHTAVELRAGDQEIHHDGERPSAIHLPVNTDAIG